MLLIIQSHSANIPMRSQRKGKAFGKRSRHSFWFLLVVEVAEAQFRKTVRVLGMCLAPIIPSRDLEPYISQPLVPTTFL